jgi:hypothetical protein
VVLELAAAIESRLAFTAEDLHEALHIGLRGSLGSGLVHISPRGGLLTQYQRTLSVHS